MHGRGQAGVRQRVGYAFVHSAVDDCSRLACSEVLPDERAATAVGFWGRALAWVAGAVSPCGQCSPTTAPPTAVLTCSDTGVRHRFTRPYRPQTNGKVERFNRTLLEEWAYVRVYRSERARTEALDRRLHQDNHHRNHTAIGGQPPPQPCHQPPGAVHRRVVPRLCPGWLCVLEKRRSPLLSWGASTLSKAQ